VLSSGGCIGMPPAAGLGAEGIEAPSRPVTTHNWDSRHGAVVDAATAHVPVTADLDSVRAANVTTALINRCRTVLTERCRYITK